jgi:hypothetical protein
MGMPPIKLIGRERDYYVEVWNDADEHYIRIEALDSFDAAAELFNKLTEGEPDMRVVMRRRAHVFEVWIPKRLRGGRDRRG